MKPKLFLCLALALGGFILSPAIANAQPGGGTTLLSLETRIMQSPWVVRGTITNLSRKVMDEPAGSRPAGWSVYTVSVEVEEVLKGPHSNTFKLFWSGIPHAELEKWGAERVSFLWFLDDSAKMWQWWVDWENIIYLGSTLPATKELVETNRLSWVYGMDMTVLSDPKDIMGRARAFAESGINTTHFHNIFIPQDGIRGWFIVDLSVPVVPSLETTAKHLIATPDDFLPKPNTNELWHCDLRKDGVEALKYFKSDENMRFLKSLLKDSDSYLDRYGRNYAVRSSAYEVLTTWGIDVPKPVTLETTPAKERNP